MASITRIGGKVEEDSVTDLATAQATRAEVNTQVSAANEAANEARAALAELEAAVDAGDSSISALAIVTARTQIEIADRKITSLIDAAKSAEDQLADARTNATVDAWEIRAPQLRAQVLEAAQALADAHDELFRVVDNYNKEVMAVRHDLAHAVSLRVRLDRGLHGVGREQCRTILIGAMEVASNPYARRGAPFTPELVGLPADVIPEITPSPIARRTGFEVRNADGPRPAWETKGPGITGPDPAPRSPQPEFTGLINNRKKGRD